MCAFLCLCVCVCVCVCVCICVCMYACTSVCVYVCVHIHVHMLVHVCTCVSVHVCLCVSTCAYTCACMCICACTSTQFINFIHAMHYANTRHHQLQLTKLPTSKTFIVTSKGFMQIMPPTCDCWQFIEEWSKETERYQQKMSRSPIKYAKHPIHHYS